MPFNFMVFQSSFTRSEMKNGLHTEYEKRVLKEFIHTLQQGEFSFWGFLRFLGVLK